MNCASSDAARDSLSASVPCGLARTSTRLGLARYLAPTGRTDWLVVIQQYWAAAAYAHACTDTDTDMVTSWSAMLR